MTKQVVQAPPEPELMYIDPVQVLADDNARFGLKKTRVTSLKESILAEGRVLEPCEGESLDQPVNGKLFRMTDGHYRLAALLEANHEGAGLLLPMLVSPTGDPLSRLRRQLAHNMERENQSAMDKAVAIKRLLDAGVPKPEVRRIFATVGGRKGNQVQPASNSYINILLSFLDFPKSIQEKLHDGRVGIAGGYELSKSPREKWSAILERVEADRISSVEKEEKDEEKLIENEKRAALAKAKLEETAKQLDDAKATVVKASEVVHEKATVAADKYKVAKLANKDAKEAAEAAAKAAEEEQNAAIKAAKEAAKAVVKLEGVSKRIAELAAKQAQRLKEAREAKPKTKPVGPDEVKNAVAAEGGASAKILNAKEMREAINDMALPGSYPKVESIGKAIQSCFNSGLTPRQMYTAVAKVTGEYVAPKKGGKEPKPE